MKKFQNIWRRSDSETLATVVNLGRSMPMTRACVVNWASHFWGLNEERVYQVTQEIQICNFACLSSRVSVY